MTMMQRVRAKERPGNKENVSGYKMAEERSRNFIENEIDKDLKEGVYIRCIPDFLRSRTAICYRTCEVHTSELSTREGIRREVQLKV